MPADVLRLTLEFTRLEKTRQKHRLSPAQETRWLQLRAHLSEEMGDSSPGYRPGSPPPATLLKAPNTPILLEGWYPSLDELGQSLFRRLGKDYLFVRTPLTVPVGGRVELILRVPDGDHRFSTRGNVAACTGAKDTRANGGVRRGILVHLTHGAQHLRDVVGLTEADFPDEKDDVLARLLGLVPSARR